MAYGGELVGVGLGTEEVGLVALGLVDSWPEGEDAASIGRITRVFVSADQRRPKRRVFSVRSSSYLLD